jgi:phosphoglycolate phosphatase-like HAD superfamily hydrolase
MKLALDLDGVLGDTRPLWEAWLADTSRRLGSIATLDPGSLSPDRAAAAKELDRWAEHGIGDWRASLVRFGEDHAPVYLRPQAPVTAALRRLEAVGARVGAFTDAPRRSRRARAHSNACSSGSAPAPGSFGGRRSSPTPRTRIDGHGRQERR